MARLQALPPRHLRACWDSSFNVVLNISILNLTFLQGAESLRGALRAVFLPETMAPWTALWLSGSPQNLTYQYANNWLGHLGINLSSILVNHGEANNSRALEPNTPLDPIWTSICLCLLMREIPQNIVVTGDNFARLSGMVDMDAKRLRMAQSRFLLWRGLMKRWNWSAARVILEWKC